MATRRKRKSNANGGRRHNGGPGVTSRVLEALMVLTGGLAQDRKTLGAERIQAMASAMQSLGHSLSEFPEARQYVRFAVQSLEGFAEYVSDTEFSQMAEDVRVFAREHPMAMMLAGLGAGLTAAQVLRASGKQPAPRTTRTASRRKVSRKSTPARQAKRAGNGSAHAEA